MTNEAIVTSAPSETRTLSRLESNEIRTRPRLGIAKKNHNRAEQMTSIFLFSSSLLLQYVNETVTFLFSKEYFYHFLSHFDALTAILTFFLKKKNEKMKK